MVMNTRIGLVSAAAIAVAVLSAPLALAAGATTHSDAFVKKAIQGNLAEIKEGRLAQRKGATAAVRRFGSVLVRDHSKANQKAIAAASSMGVTPPAEPNSSQTMQYEHLAALSGRRFDEAFVKAEVKDHEKDIAKYRREAQAPNSPASTYASRSLPVLRKHLRIAEALERHSPRG
jgi:putative membrane protein